MGRGWAPSFQEKQQFVHRECRIDDVLSYMFTDNFHAGVHAFGHERESATLRQSRLEAERTAAAQRQARLDDGKAAGAAGGTASLAAAVAPVLAAAPCANAGAGAASSASPPAGTDAASSARPPAGTADAPPATPPTITSFIACLPLPCSSRSRCDAAERIASR